MHRPAMTHIAAGHTDSRRALLRFGQPPVDREAPIIRYFDTMNILLAGRGWDQLAMNLERSLPFPVDIRQWRPADGAATLKEKSADVEVVLAGADAVLDGQIVSALKELASLKFLQLGFAGYDWLNTTLLPSGCIVANTHEHCGAIAEYVVGSILDATIGFQKIDADFRAGSWSYSGVTSKGTKHRALQGRTVGIIGYGHIGREVARRLEPFDVRLIALGRQSKQEPEAPIAASYGQCEVETFLAQCDFIVASCSLTDRTRDLLDKRAFSIIKSDAVLINVSRGPVVNEAALFEALEEGRLRAAYIDVWYQYPSAGSPSPRPSRLPFERLPNVVMTPHCSAWVEGQEQARIAFLTDNLRRFCMGTDVSNMLTID